jgi:hypothetical protein
VVVSRLPERTVKAAWMPLKETETVSASSQARIVTLEPTGPPAGEMRLMTAGGWRR